MKEVSYQIDFVHADKHVSFLQSDVMIFDGDGQAFSKFSKQQVCNVFTISQKEVRDKVDYLYADKHQIIREIDFNFLGIMVFARDTIITDGHVQAFSKNSK